MFNKIKFLINHREIRNFINYYIFTIINAAIGIFSISYLTKHILPEDYGMIGIYASILFFLPTLMSFSANGLQAIEIVDLEKDKYLEFRNSLISFVLISFSVCFIFTILASLMFEQYSFVIVMATIMGFITTFSSIHNTELFQYSQATRFGLISTVTVLLGFGLTVIFLSFFDLDWKFRIVAIVLAEFIVLIIRFFFLSTIGSSFYFIFDKVHFKYIIKYGAPLIISVLAGWVLNQSDRYFLLNSFGLKEVGLYAAAAGVASFVVMINSNMIKVIYPLVYKKLSEREGKNFILKVSGIYSVIILVISIFFCVALSFFGPFFLGKKYLSAMPIIYIMCIAQAFFGIYTTTGLVIDYFKMTKLKTILVLLSAVLVIVLSFILIPIVGIYGPAIASLLSFLFLSILSLIISLSLFKKYNVI
ncbi:oligosaccharide flippase family protein [Flavobacterium piscisymbiosum]|uniref:Oligosaccharide flippase family protein n=1 Tax=Flavobacterium piscisymbiosum TaxID=2893753 RepID=A0ABS8M8B2_9FLAO|nr:oligosaccharide flippase family protein [Flavobacterium sp. F-30]MCC9061746.1 oligosaccharide flippase family protein [Flavobacterium sp. F-30]